MPKKKRGKTARKVHVLKNQDPTHLSTGDEWAQYEPAELKESPHTFIFHRGKVGRFMKELVKDVRKVMEPFTASSLKARQGNSVKDYIAVASYFHVTHMLVFRKTDVSPYLKICRVPRGPTLTFRILNYSLARDILSSLKKQVTFEKQFHHHALLIMNNFDLSQKHLELVSETFQNMFPTININKVNLKEIRRVLLVQYSAEDDTITVRHYAITYKPVGLSRGMKKLLGGNHMKVPNLGRCEDIADFLDRDGEASESEAEDSEKVDLTQRLSARGTKGVDEVAVRLVELGPRLKMQLIKVEEGLMDGEVLYHKIVEKSDSEKLEVRKRKTTAVKIKKMRQEEQQGNVRRKILEKEKKHRRQGKYGIGKKRPGDDDEDGEGGENAGFKRPRRGGDGERKQPFNRSTRSSFGKDKFNGAASSRGKFSSRGRGKF